MNLFQNGRFLIFQINYEIILQKRKKTYKDKKYQRDIKERMFLFYSLMDRSRGRYNSQILSNQFLKKIRKNKNVEKSLLFFRFK